MTSVFRECVAMNKVHLPVNSIGAITKTVTDRYSASTLVSTCRLAYNGYWDKNHRVNAHLSSDLVTALAGLEMHDFPHFVFLKME